MNNIEVANKIRKYKLNINKKRYYDIKKAILYKKSFFALQCSFCFSIFSFLFTTTSLIVTSNPYTGIAVFLSVISVILSFISKKKFINNNKDKVIINYFKSSIKSLKKELKTIEREKQEYALFLRGLSSDILSKALELLKDYDEKDLEELHNFLRYKNYEEKNKINIKNLRISSN